MGGRGWSGARSRAPRPCTALRGQEALAAPGLPSFLDHPVVLEVKTGTQADDVCGCGSDGKRASVYKHATRAAQVWGRRVAGAFKAGSRKRPKLRSGGVSLACLTPPVGREPSSQVHTLVHGCVRLLVNLVLLLKLSDRFCYFSLSPFSDPSFCCFLSPSSFGFRVILPSVCDRFSRGSLRPGLSAGGL